MGCSNSKEVALEELRKIIYQQTLENEQLEGDLEKIKATAKPGGPGGKPPTAEHIKLLLLAYEQMLKKLTEIGEAFYESSKQHCLSTANTDEIIEFSKDLSNKIEKLEKMMLEKSRLKAEETGLELKISELEECIKELEKQRYLNEESRNQHHSLHTKVSELQTKKDEIFEELEGYEKEVENLNQEIKLSGLDDKPSSNDLSNYEVLIRMSSLEVNIELKKVDHDLEILAIEMKELRQRESELQAMEALVNSRSASRNDNRDLIPFQIRKSKERAEIIENDQGKLKEEIGLFKRNSVTEKLKDEKIEAFKEIALKKFEKDDDKKSAADKVKDRLHSSLNRALPKGSNLKNT